MLTDIQLDALEYALEALPDSPMGRIASDAICQIVVAHNAGAQEPVGYTTKFDIACVERGDTGVIFKQREDGDIALYTHPRPMPQTDSTDSLAFDYAHKLLSERLGAPNASPQTDAARDVEDAKRYRFIKSKMQVGAVKTQLPLYRSLHWIGYEDCSDVRNADAAIDAEIERLDCAKGE